VKNRQIVHWVLVADSGQARILELQRKPYSFRLVAERISEAQHLSNRELVSDASGRAYHVQGPGSHVKLPRSDPHELAEAEFTRSLAETLERARRLKSYDHLVLIADPRTLGRLRQELSPAVSAQVSEEFGIDLAGLPLNKLEPRIRGVLGWKAS
jgi:protein required for attachment to host cells